MSGFIPVRAKIAMRVIAAPSHIFIGGCMFWTTAAYAMGAPAGGAGGEPNAFASFIPIILMFAVFYFLLIRPQQKRAKEHKNMLAALKRGDEVVTAGGLFGRITETAEDYLMLDLGGGTMVKITRSAVSAVSGASRPVVEKKSKKGEARDKESKEVKAASADVKENAVSAEVKESEEAASEPPAEGK